MTIEWMENLQMFRGFLNRSQRQLESYWKISETYSILTSIDHEWFYFCPIRTYVYDRIATMENQILFLIFAIREDNLLI